MRGLTGAGNRRSLREVDGVHGLVFATVDFNPLARARAIQGAITEEEPANHELTGVFGQEFPNQAA